MIEVRDLTKRYGDKMAVDHLSFTVEPGKVTVFRGPNGAGKSTTMRLVLGLDYPNTGSATINGKPYRDLSRPLRTVGARGADRRARGVRADRAARANPAGFAGGGVHGTDVRQPGVRQARAEPGER